MTTAFLLTLQRRDELSAQEISVVNTFSLKTRYVSAKSDLVVQGDSTGESALLLSGVAARYNIVGEGRRQISAVHFAGDFVDLTASCWKQRTTALLL